MRLQRQSLLTILVAVLLAGSGTLILQANNLWNNPSAAPPAGGRPATAAPARTPAGHGTPADGGSPAGTAPEPDASLAGANPGDGSARGHKLSGGSGPRGAARRTGIRAAHLRPDGGLGGTLAGGRA